ncbi:hypothetical protein [Stenotrophomonas sp. GZD-301]|uniref:hypothetical protein n=1 Tax=Stenotrophomonas sp. GZD-301 TaxID=3404814 RepID=UPI003BB69220
MSLLLPVVLAAASLSHGPFETLPEPTGPINCPKPPATIRTVEGRIYECHPQEGEDAYRDVTPPDDKTHWMVTFGPERLTSKFTGSYHPPENWPFRAIVSSGNPAEIATEYFYVFDHRGVVIDSNEPGAIGEQMMEVRISGVRLWPSATVFYRMPSLDEKDTFKRTSPSERVADVVSYGLVVDGKMLCPVLDESLISTWPGVDDPFRPTGMYINGHCSEAYRIESTLPNDPDNNFRYYAYPGFRAGGLSLRWSFQRHDEPVRPLLNRLGTCLTFCEQP